MRSQSIFIPLVLALAACAGCQTGTFSAVIPISGGKTIAVPIGPEGAKPGEAEGYRAAQAALFPGQEARQGFYDFRLLATVEPALSRIRVEDISDPTAALLVDDAKPVFTDRLWVGRSEVMSAEDPRLAWVLQITQSFRVYKFTLTHKDGREITFNHVVPYVPQMKAAMRARWGEKY